MFILQLAASFLTTDLLTLFVFSEMVRPSGVIGIRVI